MYSIKGDDLSRTPRTPRTLSEGVEEGQGPIDSSDPAKDWDLKRVELVELHQQADILTKHHYDTKVSIVVVPACIHILLVYPLMYTVTCLHRYRN